MSEAIATAAAIAAAGFLMMYMSIQLESKHKWLKLILFCFVFFDLFLLGSFALQVSRTFAFEGVALTFFKTMNWLFRIFIFYISLNYFIEILYTTKILKRKGDSR